MEPERPTNKEDEFYQRVLDRCRKSLIDDLDPTPLLDTFLSEEVLEYTKYRDIKELTLTSEKNREILKIFRGRGHLGYNQLKHCLKKADQGHLVDTLRKAESELKRIIEMEQKQTSEQREASGMELSQRISSDRDLMEIAGFIGMNWEFLGHSLGVPTSQIDHFRMNFPGNVKMQIYRMLVQWRQSSVSPPTMGRLLEILKSARSYVNMEWEKIEGIAKNPPNRKSDQAEQSYLQRTEVLYARSITGDHVFPPTGQEKGMLSVNDPLGKSDQAEQSYLQRTEALSITGDHVFPPTGQEKGMLSANDPSEKNDEKCPLPYRRTFDNLNQPLTLYQVGLSSSLPENLNSASTVAQCNPFGNTRRQGSNFSNIPGPDMSQGANFSDGPTSPVSARDHVDAMRERSPQTYSHAGDARRLTQSAPPHSASVPENMGSQQNNPSIDYNSLHQSLNKIIEGAQEIHHLDPSYHSPTMASQPITSTAAPSVVQNQPSQQGSSVTVVRDSTDIVDSSVPSNSTDQTSLAPEFQIEGELPKCPHDGRLLTWRVDAFKFIIKNSTKKVIKGGFGAVHLYKDKLKNLGIPVVVKEIDCIDKPRHKMMSITNEKLASRTMHFAIVPLLAMTEDINTKRSSQVVCPHHPDSKLTGNDDGDMKCPECGLVLGDSIFYFLTPYLENGDLSDAIRKDTQILQDPKADKSKITLNKGIRLRIIYQVYCALEYLHTPVKGYRGIIVHMDVKSMNIVLDGSFNARLIDFGLSREMGEADDSMSVTATEVPGSKGYHPTTEYKKLTVEHDYHNFGIVIRELLTGQPPYDDKTKKELRTLIPGIILSKIQSIWSSATAPSKEARDLNNLATDCIKMNIKNVKEMIEQLVEVKWKRKESNDKCEMCMVNTAASLSTELLQHDQNCSLPISVCVSCIRNSYLNPIMCHTCGEKLVPSIGNGWGALLIAGNDVSGKKGEGDSAIGKKTLADGFSDDITKVHQVLVSKCPLVMGIEECNVEVVKPTKPGSPEAMMGKLDAAVKNLKKNRNIHTLVIYFSGHHYSDKGFLLGNDGEFLKVDRLQEVMCDIAQSYFAGEKMPRHISSRRFYIFLDCCSGPNMTTPPSPEGKKDDSNTDVKGVQRPDPLRDGERPSETMVPKLKFPDRYCILQLNACSYNKSAAGTNEGSAFTKYFVQALTQRALKTECENGQNCQDCKVLKDEFIKVHDLHEYIDRHMNHLSSGQVVRNEDEAKRHDAIIAYNVDFPVALEFRVKGYNEKETVPLQLYSKIEDLEHHLFGKLMAKLIRGIDHSLYADFTKSLCIEIDRTPKMTEELNTIPRLMAAWNSRRDLAISLRSLGNLHRGMVLKLVPLEEIRGHINARQLAKKEEKSLERFILPYKELNNWVTDLSQLQSSDNLDKLVEYLQEIMQCIEDNKKVVEVDYESTELHILFPKPVEGRQENFMCFVLQNLVWK